MYDIDLHPQPEADGVSWACYGSWSLLYMLLLKVSDICVTVTVVKTTT